VSSRDFVAGTQWLALNGRLVSEVLPMIHSAGFAPLNTFPSGTRLTESYSWRGGEPDGRLVAAGTSPTALATRLFSR